MTVVVIIWFSAIRHTTVEVALTLIARVYGSEVIINEELILIIAYRGVCVCLPVSLDFLVKPEANLLPDKFSERVFVNESMEQFARLHLVGFLSLFRILEVSYLTEVPVKAQSFRFIGGVDVRAKLVLH